MAPLSSPSELIALKQAIDDYCRHAGITDADEKLYVAELASSLYDLGAISLDDPQRGLEDAIGPARLEAA